MCYSITHIIAYLSRASAIAAALLLAGATGSSAIEVALSPSTSTYDGSPKIPVLATVPADLPVELTYRDLTRAPAPESSVVFDNTPAVLGYSYSSISFSSNQTSGVGNYLQLGGTSRQIQSVEVTMVTWAAAGNYPLHAALNPAGYSHPITLSLYQVTEANQLVFLTEVTKQIQVPWKPVQLPNGSPYPHNGFAFQAAFDFSGTLALPEKVMALISYDTSRAGFSPLGVSGPYDQLNVAVTTAPAAMGADADPDSYLKVVFDSLIPVGRWSYPDASLGNKCPMMRVRALSTRSKTQPLNAGTYEVYATLSGTTYPGAVLGNMTIDKATATVSMETSTFYTGNAVHVPVSTSPAGLPVVVQYDGLVSPPSVLGSYQVSATIADANYIGANTSTLTIRPSVRSWLEGMVAAGSIPADLAGSQDDPDGDGISNLLEYAANSNPGIASLQDAHGSLVPKLSVDGIGRKFLFRRNLNAADLDYGIECQANLASGNWQPVTGPERIVSDDGQTQVVEVTLPKENGKNLFYRLKVAR